MVRITARGTIAASFTTQFLAHAAEPRIRRPLRYCSCRQPEMFELSHPWWSLLLRAAIVYIAFMVMVRLSGKRTVGEFTPFDLLVVVLIGVSAQGGLTGGDQSVAGTLLVAIALLALNYAVGFVSARSRRFDTLTEGEPVILMHKGQVFEKHRLRNNIAVSDIDEAIRRAGLPGRHEVLLAVLETDGEITVLPRDRQ